MELPSKNRNYSTFINFGRYVAGRLTAAKLTALASGVIAVGESVKSKGRLWEDARLAETTRLAERDVADDALDTTARELRLSLMSRNLGAQKEPPYTAIFPQGLGYYTAARVDDNADRYRELLTRAEANLPADDAALVALRDNLPAQIEDWVRAKDALEAARVATGVARTELEAAVDAWMVLLDRTYGSLVTEVGRRAADSFFPRRGRVTNTDEEDDEEES